MYNEGELVSGINALAGRNRLRTLRSLCGPHRVTIPWALALGLMATGLSIAGGTVAMIGADAAAASAPAQPVLHAPAASADLDVSGAQVQYNPALDLLVFGLDVKGTAGATVPTAVGGQDGAPVLSYTFPTTLKPTAAGFKSDDGILALAVTSHPDFDDTPLWDENGDGNFTDDGITYHAHWVVLVPDKRVAGGLSVKETMGAELSAVLPPTAPNMPLFLDSPGFSVKLHGAHLNVLVPADRIRGGHDFHYDAVTAYLQVNASDASRPMLGVYKVYSVLSGNLSLPYHVVTSNAG